MKVVAFNGSPRPEGNTSILLQTVLERLEAEGIGTELVQLGAKPVSGCVACYECFKWKKGKCSITKDPLNGWLDKMMEADGILLGAPTYFTDVPANMKALIDRAGLALRSGGDLLARKLGAAVVAVRRAGATHAFDTMNHFFLISQMIVVGSSYWNIGIGREPGEVKGDVEGMETMRTLGKNMAWLLKKLGG